MRRLAFPGGNGSIPGIAEFHSALRHPAEHSIQPSPTRRSQEQQSGALRFTRHFTVNLGEQPQGGVTSLYKKQRFIPTPLKSRVYIWADTPMENYPTPSMQSDSHRRTGWRSSDLNLQSLYLWLWSWAGEQKVSLVSSQRKYKKVNLGRLHLSNRIAAKKPPSSFIQWQVMLMKMINALKFNSENRETIQGYTNKFSMTKDCPVSCRKRCPV